MKLFAVVIAVSSSAIVFLLASIFFLVSLGTSGASNRSCIKMAVEISELGLYSFEVPEAVYSAYERLCLVDIRPRIEEEEEEEGQWF